MKVVRTVRKGDIIPKEVEGGFIRKPAHDDGLMIGTHFISLRELGDVLAKLQLKLTRLRGEG